MNLSIYIYNKYNRILIHKIFIYKYLDILNKCVFFSQIHIYIIYFYISQYIFYTIFTSILKINIVNQILKSSLKILQNKYKDKEKKKVEIGKNLKGN